MSGTGPPAMTENEAIEALAALGQATRLQVFRLLAADGAAGRPAGEIAEMLGVPNNTLSTHLNVLARADLVRSKREARTIRYAANLEWLAALIRYLETGCCGGRPDACAPLLTAIAAMAPGTAERATTERTTTERATAEPRPDAPAQSAVGVDRAIRPAAPRAPGDQPRSGDKAYTVLFLCTGNSARSILAEALLGRWGADRFRAFSAGSHPRGFVHPITLRLLADLGYETDGFRSKSWTEFEAPCDLVMDFVFTVCDQAAGEACPVWPGQPLSAHWGLADPVAPDDPPGRTYAKLKWTYLELEARIKLFTSLRLEALDRLAVEDRVQELGHHRPAFPAIA